jgi:hypothetical protein
LPVIVNRWTRQPDPVILARQPENKARAHLRDSLSKLRAALPQPEILQADRDNVWLDNQRSYVDVLEFEDYAAGCVQNEQPPLIIC